MEENYWKQFWETGKVADYLSYRYMNWSEKNLESEETIESDYSDGDGFTSIPYR